MASPEAHVPPKAASHARAVALGAELHITVVGKGLGARVGVAVGSPVGDELGLDEGARVGVTVGSPVGDEQGLDEGTGVGIGVGDRSVYTHVGLVI